MYIIANHPKNDKFSIPDLGIELSKKQVVDLHCMRLKIDPEDSLDLQNAIRDGNIIPVNRSRRVKPEKKIEIPKADNSAILSEIQGIIRKEIQNSIPQKANNDEHIISTLSHLTKLVENGIPTTTISREKDEVIETEIDEDKMIDIHSKRLNKMSKDIEKSLDSKEESIKDSSILDNASELENMM